jgi:hypothetical protein
MGIASIFSSFVKGIAWTKVANVAMEYGPELYRKAMERIQPEASSGAVAEYAELQERVARLEKLLLEQEEIIREQATNNILLEKRCIAQASQLLVLKVTAGALTLGCVILLAIVFQ